MNWAVAGPRGSTDVGVNSQEWGQLPRLWLGFSIALPGDL